MLKTEMRNPNTTHIDRMDTLSMLQLINREDKHAVEAVERELDSVAAVVDAVAAALDNGGRLFYIGAGTSGRLGVMDAAECPPTFGVSREKIVGIIAGGEGCMVRAAEAQEDDAAAGERDLQAHGLCDKDVVIGISASGGASYVVGALAYANRIGALSVSIANNRGTPIEQVARLSVAIDTGPEVITGSTRMKSGTSQKLVLNMISTCAMIKTGKVYENMMVNLRPTNQKLTRRMVRIVSEIKQCDEETAEQLLEQNDWNIRRAVEK